MDVDRMALATLLGAAFPNLSDNLPTLDLWSAELLDAASFEDASQAVRRHARGVEWPSLTGLLAEVRAVWMDRALTDPALPEPWSHDDEALATETLRAAVAEFKARHSE